MSEAFIPFGDLSLTYMCHREIIDRALNQVLEKGWFVLGKTLEQFESSFAAYCGVKYGVGVGSGTEALHLALLACGIERGSEVITVANTCVPTVAAISFAGGVPVLVDIDPATYTMDASRIEERITERTSAIVPVHLYGQCADMDSIGQIAAKYDLRVVEDCAQAHGATYKGRMAGSMGDMGCYSFYPSKNLGAYGDAGMVICKDPAVANLVRSLRNYGQTRRYVHERKGFNSRLDEIQASILLAKLPHLKAYNRRRREIAHVYTEAFRELDWLIAPTEGEGRHHVFHLYVVRTVKRGPFQEYLQKHGIETLIHYPIPIHQQPAYVECLPQAKYLSVTDSQAPHLLSLPLYPEMTDSQVNHVIETVRAWNPMSRG